MDDTWKPSDKQYQAYLARETELAEANVKQLAKAGYPRRSDTLHSELVFFEGFQRHLWSKLPCA